ncbi:hypothetical protein ACQZ61_20900 [Agrobacterium vitis]|uniref:hypothetical protein n=1 Tax=Agrobacterium vitis TaxID=373 RepID=UPI0015D96833|nr:hypothetical protein [Agrobacterium vitis]MCF1455325.1 hypothetical protein [Agrobacterium vitis]
MPVQEAYFHLQDVPYLQAGSWVPLRQISSSTIATDDPDILLLEEWIGIGSAAVVAERHKDVEALAWDDLGIQPHRSVVENAGYRSADVFRNWQGGELGINLVISQLIDGVDHEIWHLHTDLVVALHLVREGDVWKHPEEDWIEVARLKRDSEGKPTVLEIRKEYLSDYLTARGMDLYCSSYRERTMITATKPAYAFDDTPSETRGRDSWDRTTNDAGYPFPAGSFFTRGALWRTEWVQSGGQSVRVRGDKDNHSATFALDPDGNRVLGPQLIGSNTWLFFNPSVADALLCRRGSKLHWYSAETGALGANEPVHFGLNSLGLITVFAKDIGQLPQWEQRLWSAYNVTPEGGVSSELFAAQMMVQPAATVAPEREMGSVLEAVEAAFKTQYGKSLLRDNEAVPSLLRRLHRFQAVKQDGILELAKDLTRLFMERIDAEAIAAQLSLSKNEKRPGSLKLLERLLSTKLAKAEAGKLMSPLFGIYDLRLADAHLGSARIESGRMRTGIDDTLPAPMQGRQLLHSFNETLKRVTGALV